MDGNDLRIALGHRDYVFGTALEGYGHARWPRYFSKVGLDFVFMDTEHSPNNRETIAWATQLYAALGIAPLVRISEASPSEAAQMLDLGAHGVVVPYVESLSQVKDMVGAIKYRPMKGKALTTAMQTGSFENESTRKYLEDFNQDAVLLVMIESRTGLDNLGSCLSFGNVDGVLIGPHDLSVSIGFPEQYDHPEFKKCAHRIVQICNQIGVSVGIHISWGDIKDELYWINNGCNIVLHSSDTVCIASNLSRELGLIRQSLDLGEKVNLANEFGLKGHSA